MFHSSKYATQSVADCVPLHLQIMLWTLIERKRLTGEELDYLQVFELSLYSDGGQSLQQVIHRQEVPPFAETHYFETEEIYVGKIWTMDNGDHATMLLPSDH